MSQKSECYNVTETELSVVAKPEYFNVTKSEFFIVAKFEFEQTLCRKF